MILSKINFSKQLKYFLIIGLLAFFIDYIIYRLLFFLISNINISKFFGFLFGTLFSFKCNTLLTFKSKKYNLSHFLKFIYLYVSSMIINIIVNHQLFKLFSISTFNIQISFVFATLITASINFLGMKYFVFKNNTY